MGEQSLSIFFNSSFQKQQEDVSYEGGSHIVMPIQTSNLSHRYILDLLSSVGCNDIEVVRFRIPGKMLADGLRVIIDEFDVRSLISHFSICDNIELYVQHPCAGRSTGESSRQGDNVVDEEIDSEEDDDYIAGSSEDSDEELMEARRALKLAKQRSAVRTKQVDRESGYDCIVTGDDDTEYEPSKVEDNASDETNYSEAREMDDFEVVEGEGSGEEEIARVKNRFLMYDKNSKEPIFCVSMVFDGPKEFRDAIKKHSITAQREIVFKKNDKQRVRAVCAKPNCPWLMYGAYERNTQVFHLKTYRGEHTCGISLRNKWVKSSTLAEVFGSTLKAAPDIKLTALKELVRKEMGIDVTKSQCRQAKLRVFQEMMGSEVKEYALLWDYAQENRTKNPGSTIILNVRRDFDANRVMFDRFYVCFSACKRGFLDGCRKVIGVDGCFLKGVCKGEVLSAIGRDANNQMFPIAWAVVRIENKDTWNWFMERLMEDLGIDRDDGGEGWTIVSDKQKGLLDAISKLMPSAEHRMCARHIYANWGSKHKGRYFKQIFWTIAKSTNKVDYEAASRWLYNGHREAWTDLMKTDPQHWCRSFFSTDVKCDIVENNLCEAFNGCIVDARVKSIITMLKEIRLLVMERIYTQRDNVRKWHNKFGARIMIKLEESKKESRWCMARWNGGDAYEVQHNYDMYNLDLSRRTCACRAWDLSGIPCCHAVAAIVLTGGLPEDFIDVCYSKGMFLKSYAYLMDTISGEKFWKKTRLQGPEPLPPRKKLGRLPKARRKEPLELVRGDKMTRSGRRMTCSNCKQQGHNRATCKKSSSGADQPSGGGQQRSRVKLNHRRAMTMNTGSANGGQQTNPICGEQEMLVGSQSSVANWSNSSDQMNRPLHFSWDMLQQDDVTDFPPPQQTPTANAEESMLPFQHTTVREEILTSGDIGHPVSDAEQGISEEEALEEDEYGLDEPVATEETNNVESYPNLNKKKKTMADKVVSFFKRRSSRLMSSLRKNYLETSSGRSNQSNASRVIDLD